MPNLQERLKQFIHIQKISELSFETRCGLSVGAVSKMSDKTYARTLNRIAIAFPQLNIGWLKTGEGEMLNPVPDKSVHVRQDHNADSTMFGYVNIAVPEKGKQKSLNADGIVVESDDPTSEQIQHYKSIIDSKDEQIARLLSMIEEKDRVIAKLMERL